MRCLIAALQYDWTVARERSSDSEHALLSNFARSHHQANPFELNAGRPVMVVDKVE